MRYSDHKAKWEKCKLCELCYSRKRVVLARGTIPADVLFIGEAPGASEDVLGTPFIGPAGKLLDELIADAIENCLGVWSIDDPPRQAFTNLVACIPLGDDGAKVAEPPKISIEACAPRLLEFIGLAKPRLIVMVGTLSEKWVPKLLERIYDPRKETKAGGVKTPQQRSRPTKAVLRDGHTTIANTKRPTCVGVIHPAAILRMDVSKRGLVIQRTIVTLADAFSTIPETSPW